MTIDHFRPNRHGLRLDWCNLYYSCFACNSKYKREHPTEEEELLGHRFVDVCAEDSDEHYSLAVDPTNGDHCKLVPLTDVARYSACILRLGERPDLRDFWRGLDKSERWDLARLGEIDRLLAMLERFPSHAEHDVDADLDAIRTDYRAQREHCFRRLAEIRARRPFPYI